MKMKEIVIRFIVAASSALIGLSALAGWSSTELLDKYEDIPSKLLVLDTPVTLYGTKVGNEWHCCSVTWDKGLASFVVGDAESKEFTSYMSVLTFGNFDDDASIDWFLDSLEITVEDEMGEQQDYYAPKGIEDLYLAYDTKNQNAFKTATEQVQRKIEAYYASLKTESNGNGGETSSGDGSISDEEAKSATAIKDAIVEATKTQAEQIENLKSKIPSVQNELRKREVDLAGWDDQAAQDASASIAEALSSFDAAVAALDAAIADNDFSALTTVNANLESSLNSLGKASSLIGTLSGDGVSETKTVLDSVISTITAAKLAIEKAKSGSDMSSASEALASLRGLNRFNDLKLKWGRAKLLRKKAVGEAEKMSDTLEILLALLAQYDSLYATALENQSRLDTMLKQYLDDMNRIGAYLGSTNAMQYFSEKRDIFKMTEGDFKRWYRFSPPEGLADIDDYETIGKLSSGGSPEFNNILRTIGSSYFMMYCDANLLDRFVRTYDGGSFADRHIRGFYEQIGSGYDDTSSSVTNWYASHITAPVNWADGETIFVTNGAFQVSCTNIDVVTDISFDFSATEGLKCTVTKRKMSFVGELKTFIDSETSTETNVFEVVEDSHHVSGN